MNARCLLLPLLASLSVPILPAADWPQWRGPNRDGISAETGWNAKWPASGPSVLWKHEAGTGCSSVVTNGGRLYTAGHRDGQDEIQCLDATSGAPAWKFVYPAELGDRLFEGGPTCTPTFDEGRIYQLGRQGGLFCLSADKGELVWKKDLPAEFGAEPPKWGFTGSPLVFGRLLIVDVGGKGSGAVGFDKTTGEVVWKEGDDPAAYGAPILFEHGGKTHVASFNASGLVLREAATGQALARAPWKTSYDINAITPIISGDRFFVASGYNKGAGLFRLKDGEMSEVWTSKKLRAQFSSCVLWEGHVYGFDEQTFTCLRFDDGEVKWRQEGLGKGAIAMADGKLVIQGEKGDLAIAEPNPDAYVELSRAKVLSGRCWVVPVLSNGRIYAKNNKGQLVCLDVSR